MYSCSPPAVVRIGDGLRERVYTVLSCYYALSCWLLLDYDYHEAMVGVHFVFQRTRCYRS